MNQNKFQYKVQGVDYDVEIEEMEGNLAKVNVNGITFEVELQQPINPSHIIKRTKVEVPQPADNGSSKTTTTQSVVVQPKAEAPASGGAAVKAPLPGTITAISVKVGDKVNVGDTVIVLEAMKMQNNIEADTAGTVTSIAVNQGDTVMEGATLLTIA